MCGVVQTVLKLSKTPKKVAGSQCRVVTARRRKLCGRSGFSRMGSSGRPEDGEVCA